MSSRWIVAVSMAALTGGASLAQTGELVFLSPDAETVVTGTTVLVAEIHPARLPVKEVVFFVDGVRACASSTGPRFRCEWDAGPRLNARHVRAVARLDDGSQLTAALRTKELDISERTVVDAVVVSTHVTDSRGRFLKGLTADDFRVMEDGRLQKVTSLTTEEGGADIVLALDISLSMQPVLDQLKASALRFLGAVRPQDQVTLAGFNTGLFVVATPATPAAVREAQIGRMRAFGRTSLYDSLVRAAELYKSVNGRRALVVFTDGDDVSSRGSPETVRTALQGRDVVLYVAGQGRAADDKDLKDRLRAMADETGGAAFFASKMSALDEHFARIVEDIGNQYVLTYTPDRPISGGAWREIRVDVPKRRADVRARQGYFAERSTEPR